jgi:hypothetical protein
VWSHVEAGWTNVYHSRSSATFVIVEIDFVSVPSLNQTSYEVAPSTGVQRTSPWYAAGSEVGAEPRMSKPTGALQPDERSCTTARTRA